MRPDQNLYIIGPKSRLYLSWSDDRRFWVVLLFSGSTTVVNKRFKPDDYASALALFNQEKVRLLHGPRSNR